MIDLKSFFPVAFVFLFFLFFNTTAQTPSRTSYLKDLVLKIDTSSYSWAKNSHYLHGERSLVFQYQNNQSIGEINFYTYDFDQIAQLKLHPSGDFEIIDSLVIINEEFGRAKIRFNNITKSNYLNFTFTIVDANSGKKTVQEIKLFPTTHTTAHFYPDESELYIGEEKIFELISNNPENLKLNTQWTSGEEIDYRFSEKNGQLRIHLLPNSLGSKTISTKIETYHPSFDNQKADYTFPQIQQPLLVKASRLGFLNIDRKEVSLNPGTVEDIEIQLDNSRQLLLQKTYRIEDKEEPGGALIAEIFTRNSLSNNRILCFLRVYAYHRQSDGYLYIKDGDEAKFITNFSITPIASVKRVSILREGSDWTNNLTVKPGEVLDVKIEGQGLHKANFHFDGAQKIASDSLIANENMAVHKIRVPMNIIKNQIQIYNNSESTGYTLSVKEHQQPHPLNFITLNYGAGDRVVTGINKTILYDKTISDIAVNFRSDLLDGSNNLHGKQYLDMEIRITGPKNELIEMKVIEDIVVCPANNSPRYAFYHDPQCTHTSINLNNYIGRKTYNLDDWSRIQIIFKHKKDKYNGEGYSERVEIILQKHVTFDIDVSFPAGLITRIIGSEEQKNFSSLGGISMAMIAQLSFFRPNKIAQYRPYRVGAGFIALDAFNFSPEANSNRDVGVVLIGTLYPAKRDVKLSFPLNLGGGYLMQKEKWFFLIGPGIRVRF